MKQSLSQATLICKACGGKGKFANCTTREADGATTDYNHCGRLLIMRRHDDLIVYGYDFHEEMHKRNPDWPADGANTGFLEVAS